MSSEPHPLALLLPEMPPAAYAELRESIRVNGQREPITLHQDGRIIAPALTSPETASRSMLAGFAEAESIVAASGTMVADAEAETIPPPEPPVILPPRPLGPVVAGVAVATPEWLAWRARRDRAICLGQRFDEPAPQVLLPRVRS